MSDQSESHPPQPKLGRDPVNGNYTFDRMLTAHSRVYTAYVKYVFGDDPKDYSVEEIDVTAKSMEEAATVALAALAQDYEPGGEIIEVREQIGMYF